MKGVRPHWTDFDFDQYKNGEWWRITDIPNFAVKTANELVAAKLIERDPFYPRYRLLRRQDQEADFGDLWISDG
jgi:hypothetical protein